MLQMAVSCLVLQVEIPKDLVTIIYFELLVYYWVFIAMNRSIYLEHHIDAIIIGTIGIIFKHLTMGITITVLKVHEPMLCEAISVVVGPFFIFATVKCKGPE